MSLLEWGVPWPSEAVYSGVPTPLTPSTRLPTPIPSRPANSHRLPSEGRACPCSTADTNPLDRGAASSDWVIPIARRRSRTLRPSSTAAVEPAPACNCLAILDLPMAEPYHFGGCMANAAKVLSPGGPFKKGAFPCLLASGFRVRSSPPGSSAQRLLCCRRQSCWPAEAGRPSRTETQNPRSFNPGWPIRASRPQRAVACRARRGAGCWTAR